MLIQHRFDRWLKKRVPSNTQHKLSNRNIFIMPTRFGFAYLIFVVVLFLLGTNYQNNIILLLSYLLASLFITVMLHSFYNFSQLCFSSINKQNVFANQTAYIPMQIYAQKVHFDINFHFVEQGSLSDKIKLTQCEIGENKVLLPIYAQQRGVFNLGRVKVFSEYSLGLFITWAMLDFSHQLIVFPQPKKMHNGHQFLSSNDDSVSSQQSYQSAKEGIDDFSELKNYIVGESQARVAWKQLARGQGKLTKHYQNQQGSLAWLKLCDMPSNDIEEKLRYLCFLIIEYSKKDQEFGLILSLGAPTLATQHNNNFTSSISPNTGYKHQQQCLTALAEFSNQRAKKYD